jgi:hypothetical protein
LSEVKFGKNAVLIGFAPGSCEKIYGTLPSSSFIKSPLAPLFQRGEPKSGVFRITDLRFFLSTSHLRNHPPFEKIRKKGGVRGDFSDVTL